LNAGQTLATLRNLGPASTRMLMAAGIDSPVRLRELGAVAAYLRVLGAGFRPSLNLLWALAGALGDCDWRELPPGQRGKLLLELDQRRDAEAGLVRD